MKGRWQWNKGGEAGGGAGRSVTSDITSSEMHLDSVSICQNKAASTAATLMAVDVSDGGGAGGARWWHLHIQRDAGLLQLACTLPQVHTRMRAHTQHTFQQTR